VGTYLVGQLAVSASQLTAHYVNEYADVEADALVTNRTWFSGGSGVLTRGSISPPIALRAAYVTSVVSLLAATGLGVTHPLAAFIVVGTLVISWAYSMPPIRLLNTGWGEMATTVVVTIAVPLVGALGQPGRVDPSLWWAIAALFFVHMAMILAFELPDLESDRLAGKRVLAVRLGRATTVRLIVGCYAIALAMVVTAAFRESPRLAWMLIAAPPISVAIANSKRESYGVLTSAAVSAVGATAIGGIIALW
jgi:1,4-dihydroxy-2-naphthoate octaprenyltransferase